MSPLSRASLFLATSALLAGLAPAATADNPLGDGATGGGAHDPVGDVVLASDQVVLSQDEIDSIDITTMVWKVVTGRYVAVKLRLVDVQPAGAHRALYGVNARAGRKSVLLAARGKRVVVVDGKGTHRCRGGKTSINEKRELVRISFPVRCLRAKRYDFAPIAVLETRQGGQDLASDETRPTGRVRVR